MKIAAAGGGTAGHLFPALAVIEEFQKKHDVEVVYFVVEGKIDETLIKSDHPSFEVVPLRTRGLQRPIFHLKNAKRFFQYFSEIRKIRKVLRSFQPDIVFSAGGYAGGLLGLATKTDFSLFIHEQNVKPGVANLHTARFARRIFVSFEASLLEFPKNLRDKIVVSGNPVREIHWAKRYEEIPDGVVLVLGGSLGSEEINTVMERVYEMDRKNIYYHSTGSEFWVRKLSRFKNVRAFKYIDFMPILWRKAKFVVARAGATTVAEMIHYKVGGILLPWMGSAESHQLANALEAEKAGLARVVIGGKMSPREILEEINRATFAERFPMDNPAKTIYKVIMEEIT